MPGIPVSGAWRWNKDPPVVFSQKDLILAKMFSGRQIFAAFTMAISPDSWILMLLLDVPPSTHCVWHFSLSCDWML